MHWSLSARVNPLRLRWFCLSPAVGRQPIGANRPNHPSGSRPAVKVSIKLQSGTGSNRLAGHPVKSLLLTSMMRGEAGAWGKQPVGLCVNSDTFDGDLRQCKSAASAALDLPVMFTRRRSGGTLGPLHWGAPRIHARLTGCMVQFMRTSGWTSGTCKPAIRASVGEGTAAANARNNAPKIAACGNNRLSRNLLVAQSPIAQNFR